MSRYIDADALMKDIWSLYRDEEHIDYNVAIVNALNVIDEQSTADVAEVVRCKDCRYWQEYQEGHYPNELCPWDKNETPDEDDYCSYGERREDAT